MAVLTMLSVRRSRLSADALVPVEGHPMSWYYCLEHQRVEPEEGCPNAERMGPYPTEEAAHHALERAAERNAAFDEDDD